MRIQQDIIPKKFLRAYDLTNSIHNGLIYMHIICGMYGLPQAGILANKLICAHLPHFGYYKVDHAPGLWRHKTLPIALILVVDNFVIKYIDTSYAKHLLDALQQ